MTTYLPPVAKPRGAILKIVYFVTRRQFGKVATPIAVFSARMPVAFLSFYGKVSRLDKKLRLPSSTAVLVRERVASINACLFCMDAAKYYAMKKSPADSVRLEALAEYRTSPLFSDAERAALDYATELTSRRRWLPRRSPASRRHYGEREICDIVWLVASEHLYNISNIGLNIGSDGFCELAPAAARPPASARPDAAPAQMPMR